MSGKEYHSKIIQARAFFKAMGKPLASQPQVVVITGDNNTVACSGRDASSKVGGNSGEAVFFERLLEERQRVLEEKDRVIKFQQNLIDILLSRSA